MSCHLGCSFHLHLYKCGDDDFLSPESSSIESQFVFFLLMIRFPAVLITGTGSSVQGSHVYRPTLLLKRPVESAAFALGWGYSFTSYTFQVIWKAKAGIVGLKLNLNFIPCLHSSWDHLQVDVIWRRRFFYLCAAGAGGQAFPPLLHAWMWEKPPLVVAFWYGNMFFFAEKPFL